MVLEPGSDLDGPGQAARPSRFSLGPRSSRPVPRMSADRAPTAHDPAPEVTHGFAAIAVTDFAVAYQWYVRLFARTADMFPRDGEAARASTALLCRLMADCHLLCDSRVFL